MPVSQSIWKQIVIHIIVPAGLTIVLFVGSLFLFVLPTFKETIFQSRKDLIREQVNSVHNLLVHYQERVTNGELTLEDAQKRVIERIRSMRYGSESKDYFWINDMNAAMIMHPYRTDLEGQSMAEYADSQGKLLVMEFVKVAKARQAGYVDYMWQWKDEPDREVPKISYVRLFEPWGWIIGTGVYIEDVKGEIRAITGQLACYLAAICLIIAVICGYLIWHGIKAEIGRQEVEQERERLMKSLSMKNEEMQSIVSITSHDLRSPLINIQGFSGELEKACRQITAFIQQDPRQDQPYQELRNLVESEIPEALGYIKSNTDKMQFLVNGLLQLSRIGSATLDIRQLNMKELIESVVNACQYQIKTTGATVTLGELPAAKGDPKQINQVFTNLIDNALKYRHPDRPPEIRVTGRLSDGQVEFAVADNGQGIESRHLTRIFEMFHQLHPENDAEGVGLGLTIVKRILDIQDGSIRVESQIGQGSTFYVALPAG